MAEKKTQSIVKKFPLLTAIVLFFSGLCFVLPSMSSLFIFDRSAILQGQVWRLLSCHFVHFSGTHIAYNLIVFGAAGWLVERAGYLHFSVLFVSIAIVAGGSLFVLRPAMDYYGGLSGIACGFIYYYSLIQLTNTGPWKIICKLIILFLPIKIFVEAYNNASILPYWAEQTFVIMPFSHISGISVAILLYFILEGSKRFSNQRLKKDGPFRRATWPTS